MVKNNLPSLDAIKTVLYPELIAASLKNNESDLYVIWSVLKAIDKYCDGSSKIKIENLLKIIYAVLGLESSQAYKKVKKGIGLYWNKPGVSSDGEKVTTLLGIKNVVSRLKPTSTRSEPFVFHVRDLEKKQDSKAGDLKKLMISAVAAKYVDSRPLSIRSICELTNQSESTVRRALKECEDLNTIKNFQMISAHKTIIEARAAILKISSNENILAYKIEKEPEGYVIYRQRPNVYFLTKPERLPLRKRPKELKAKDNENMSNLSKKLYYHEESKKPVEYEHLKFSSVKYISNKPVVVWSGKNILDTNDVFRSKSTAGKWQDIKRGMQCKISTKKTTIGI